MNLKKATTRTLNGARLGLAFLAMMQFSVFGPLLESAKADDHPTLTPTSPESSCPPVSPCSSPPSNHQSAGAAPSRAGRS